MVAESEDTEEIYERAGFDSQVGYGSSPAVIVVDLQTGFTDPDHPLGGDLMSVIDKTNVLLEAAHDSDVPVVLSRIVVRHPDGHDLGIWGEKAPAIKLLEEGSEWTNIDPTLDVRERDYILDKRQASVFHQTELNSMLNYWGIDTVVVTGCTTSGCVRASVVDACSHGYRTIVPSDAVGDRASGPHEANLFDMNAKYGDVMTTEKVRQYLLSI